MSNSELKACPFWSKVDKKADKECWHWLGAKNKKGYGNYRSNTAHRVSYEKTWGEIPDGLEIDHLCRNRGCVNPHHLEAVTHQENVRRAQPSHCKYGHPLSGDNIRLRRRSDGVRRVCKKCRVRETQLRRLRKKEKEHAAAK